MFSTFTGSSKRPRNVNLSGQARNPFANTAWSPSLASSASKTVSDAQAERERRQLERQRLKGAATIQRVWRGHRSRSTLADNWRATFDHVYLSASDSSPSQRLLSTFNLLLAFFSVRRGDDIRRVFLFARDSDAVHFEQAGPINAHPARLRRLTSILIMTLNAASSKRCVHRPEQALLAGDQILIAATRSGLQQEFGPLLKLVVRIISRSPATINNDLGDYFQTMARLSRVRDAGNWIPLFVDAVTTPLRLASEISKFIANHRGGFAPLQLWLIPEQQKLPRIKRLPTTS